MQTLFDWLSVLLFALIALTYLQRSLIRTNYPDPVWRYIPPVAGCVTGNWLGNNGHPAFAIILLLTSVLFFIVILRPLRSD